MKVTELDKILNEMLVEETRNLIMEQVSGQETTGQDTNTIANFQSLAPLRNKISEIENAGTDNFSVVIVIDQISEQEFSQAYGSQDFNEAEKKLVTELHGDLEQAFGQTFDIDIDVQDNNGFLRVFMRISGPNAQLGEEEEMQEKQEILLGTKQTGINTNPTMSESKKKKTVTLTEVQMESVIKKIVSEAVPGLDTAKAVHVKSGTQNSAAIKAVEKKIKDYLSFKGNDHPEFPDQIGKGDEKAARKDTPEEEQEISDNRGRGPQDLDYDTEPSKEFKERLKLSLIGDPKMGNPTDAANVVKTDVGKDMHKQIAKRKENLKKEPIYPKETVPTRNSKEDNRIVNEEIERMKQMSSYNKKTQ